MASLMRRVVLLVLFLLELQVGAERPDLLQSSPARPAPPAMDTLSAWASAARNDDVDGESENAASIEGDESMEASTSAGSAAMESPTSEASQSPQGSLDHDEDEIDHATDWDAQEDEGESTKSLDSANALAAKERFEHAIGEVQSHIEQTREAARRYVEATDVHKQHAARVVVKVAKELDTANVRLTEAKTESEMNPIGGSWVMGRFHPPDSHMG